MARTDHRFDRELFHAWLWSTRGRRNMVTMSQAEMSRALKCSPQTPSRLIAELIAAGKVKKVKNGMYQVVDPSQTSILN